MAALTTSIKLAEPTEGLSHLKRGIKERRSEVPKNYLFGIYQGFGCGIGMCDVCAVRTEDGVKLACMKGPSFDLTLVKLDSVVNRDAPQEAGSSDGA